MAIEMTSGDIFTPEQLSYHAKVYAGPGAGKTHFLVENVKNIIANNPQIVQSRARKVLCVTYINAAVDEIKRRSISLQIMSKYILSMALLFEHIIQPFQQDLKRYHKNSDLE